GNPGPGGWCAYIINPDGTHRNLTGTDPNTTNQRMELMASIAALEAFPDRTELTIYSDSQYVIKGMNEWLDGWIERGWKTAQKKPVANADLWKRLDRLAAKHSIEWVWVRGHNGNEFNDRADRLAREAAKKAVELIERTAL